MRERGLDQIAASESMKVARAYGTRPEIYRRLSWIALFELSPNMSPVVRRRLEAQILAQRVRHSPQIHKARWQARARRPKRPIQQPAPQKMAA